MNGIGDDAARMFDKLTAYHKLKGCVGSEGVPHAAMPSGDSGASGDSIEQRSFLFFGKHAHGPTGYNQIVGK